MERWQREYITAKLPDLIANTRCNTNFLSILRSKGVLAAADLDGLDATGNMDGKLKQTISMYDIITTRVGAYDVLVQALHETNQTGARNELLFGYLRQGILPPFTFADEIFDWKSEDFSLHDEILSKYVKVQNKNVLLKNVCRKINSEKIIDIIERTIDKTLVFEILSTGDFVLINNTIPDKVEYYIPRTLAKRCRLNESVLRDNETDIFVVKGATWNQLSNMTSLSIVDRSSNQLDKLTVRHILCELDEDFDTICATSCSKGKNVHLLNFDRCQLEWIRTHGSTKSLHRHIHENQDKIPDNILIENLRQQQLAQLRVPVCISDAPGMGKTILLTEIANEFNETAQDNTLVFFFVLREFVQHLPTKVKDVTAEKIMELISTQVTTSNFGKEIVQCLLSTPDQNIELCFDGFDEILESQIEVTKKLLKIIRLEFNNTRLHVTTRSHMRHQLEETLGVLGFIILPFEEDDQVKFLVDFWKCTQKLPSDRAAMLKKFAQRCLTTLKEKMVEDEHDIAGVPLQCRLLGEIYQKRVKRMLSGPVNDDDDVPLVNSIYQMYHNLMLLRFERATEQQSIRDRAYFGMAKLLRVLTYRKSWVLKVEEMHVIMGLDVLFPALFDKGVVKIPQEYLKYMESKEIYDIGLIEAKATFNRNYRFSHRTFAEFLVAKFLVKVMTSQFWGSRKGEFWITFLHFLFFDVLNTTTKVDIILEHEVTGVVSEVQAAVFSNPIIAYFINAHLKNHNQTSLDLVDFCTYLECMQLDDSTFGSIFIACAASNLEYLFNFMMSIFKTMKQHIISLPAELLVIAAKYSGFELNRLIHNSFSDKEIVTFNCGSNKGDLVTPSQTVVQRGNQPVLQVLLNTYKGTCISKNLLHICLTGSHFDSMDTIFRKIEIIKLLLEQAPYLCNEKLEEDGTTPILQSYAHLELIQCLLENGADVNAVSKNQENVLHVFLNGNEKYKIEEYVLIELLMLLRKFKFGDYNQVNVKGETTLGLAVCTMPLTVNSLRIFKDQGADFSFINKQNETLLHTAIKNEQSIDCIQTIKDFGADVNAVNSNFESVLHIAADVGYKKAVEFLITEVSNLVNAPDAKGNRPLHFAFKKESNAHLQIQDILIENGGDVHVLNDDGCTSVEYGLIHSANLVIDVERLEVLEMHGFKVFENEKTMSQLKSSSLSIIKWNDFTEQARNLLLEKHLHFQGQRLTLKELCQKITSLNGHDRGKLLKNLEPWFVMKLFNDEEPEIANGNIPSVPEHYILRHLVLRVRISRKILSVTKYDCCNDVFVFKCENLQLYHLQSFVCKYGDGHCDSSGNQLKKNTLSCCSIFLETNKDFEEIRILAQKGSIPQKSVHLLECVSNSDNIGEILTLRWLESVGSIMTVQKFIHKIQKSFPEEEFYNSITSVNNMPVCISDKTGMGKSCLLSNFANQLQKFSQTTNTILHVQYIRMNDLVANLKAQMSSLNSKDRSPTVSHVLKALVKSSCSIKAGRSLLKSTLEAIGADKIKMVYGRKIRFEFFFDGMEELNSFLLELALCALRTFYQLSRSLPFDVRIWMTTRPDLLNKVEECLGILGHTIKPFEENDKASLLTRHWADSGEKEEEEMIFEIAELFLRKLKEKLSHSNEDNDITGSPLFWYLIAQVYKNDARLIYQQNQTKQFDRRVIDITTTKIYEQYINNRFLECGKSDLIRKRLFSSHIEIGVEVLFPEFITKRNQLKREALLRPGLLETSNVIAPLKFVHITFAAYFAAQSVFRLLEDAMDTGLTISEQKVALFVEALSVEKANFSVSNVMPLPIVAFKFQQFHVCYFLNFSVTLEFDITYLINWLIIFYEEDIHKLGCAIWSWLLASISANFINIASSCMNALSILLRDYQCFFDDFPFFDLLLLTAKCGSEELMEKVCYFSKQLTGIPIIEYFIEFVNKNNTFEINPLETLTPLHIAIEAGNFKVFHLLLVKEGFMAEIYDSRYRYLLHWCLLNSLNDCMVVVNRKKEILNYIADEMPYFLTTNPVCRDLLLEQMHLELMLTYIMVKTIKERENRLAPQGILKNRHGENFLHLLAFSHYDENMSATKYHETIIRLHKIKIPFGLLNHLEDRNFFDWRAVDIAISSFDLLDDTLEFFKSIKVNYTATDFRGSTPLFKAVAGQRPEIFLQKLKNHGATWDFKYFEVTILHVAAAFFNYSAVRFCINKLNQNVNAQDSDGNTPLHMCFLLEDMIMKLQSQAQEWKATVDWKNTIFSMARSHVLPISKRFKRSLIGSGCSSSCLFTSTEDVQCRGVKQVAQIEHEPSNQHQIISFLIDKGAEISMANNMGITPMYLALDICLGGLEEQERELLQQANYRVLFEKKYMTIALKGVLLNTKLGYLWHPSLVFIFATQIIKHGGDIKLTDDDGSSLLHLASKAHSLFGIKYLIEVGGFSANIVNENNQTPLDYMDCTEDCKMYNHLAIRKYLRNKVDLEM